ncbi:MAG: sodium:proton antiporter [Deltaproteobacteria bacterium]|nr:sodium:proton antiporter [Deltaproteobacteria bacterium]
MIEHIAAGYLGLLLLALVAAVVTEKIWNIPYIIALVIIGAFVGLSGIGPSTTELGFSRELVFFVLLPPLLFFGGLHMQIETLLRHLWPIFLFSVVGVVLSTAVIGSLLYFFSSIANVFVALLLGAILSPTDPVSVLSLFKKIGVSEDLKHLVEGEALFNDGTAVVLFMIILEHVQGYSNAGVIYTILSFLLVTGGGILLGLVLGYLTWLFLKNMDSPVIETTACLTLALGSYWLGEYIHVSGVITTVTSGLLIGNYGKKLSMSTTTSQVARSFFEVIDFLINSVLFVLLGLELQEISNAGMGLSGTMVILIVVTGASMLVSRAAAVYPMYFALNLVGRRRPGEWAHILFWGGLRGSIPAALLLGLPTDGPIAAYRTSLLIAGFSAIMFSLVVQGLTIKPLVELLKLGDQVK